MLGGAALTGGVKFLYDQVSELLKRRRERKEAAKNGSEPPAAPEQPITSEVLVGELRPTIDDSILEARIDELLALKKQLLEIGEGEREADPADAAVIRDFEQLRALLEAIFGQRITFEGESDRPPTGSAIAVTMKTENVDGEVVVADLHEIRDGSTVTIKSEHGAIGKDAKLTGLHTGHS